MTGRRHCALDAFTYVHPKKAVLCEIECTDPIMASDTSDQHVHLTNDAKAASPEIRVIGRLNGRIAQPDNSCWASDQTDNIPKFPDGSVILAANLTDGILESQPLSTDEDPSGRVPPSMVSRVRRRLSKVDPLAPVDSYVYDWYSKRLLDERLPPGVLAVKQKIQVSRVLLSLSGEDLLKLREMPPLFRLLFGDGMLPWAQRDNGLFVDMPCLRPEILQLFEDFTGTWEWGENAVFDRSLLLWTCLFIKAYRASGAAASPVDLNTFIQFHWECWQTLTDNDQKPSVMESDVQNRVIDRIVIALIEHPISLARVLEVDPSSPTIVDVQLDFFRLVFQWNASINRRQGEADLCDTIVSRIIRSGRCRDLLLSHFWPAVASYGQLVTDPKAFFCGPEIEKVVLGMVETGERERLCDLLFHQTCVPVQGSDERHLVATLWRTERPEFYAKIFAHEKMLPTLPLALRALVNSGPATQ